MMGNCSVMIGWRRGAGWLPGLLIFFLAFGLAGCAGPSQVVPPPQPAPSRPPVRVSTSPPRLERKDTSRKEAQAKADAQVDDRAIEGYTAALKKIPTSRRQPPPKGEKVYPIDLNLKNADLVEAVRVLADTMGINYSIDPKVKGTVNVRASGKLSQSELMSIMETLLTVNGAGLIKGDKIYKIVPLDKAATQALPVYSRDTAPVGMRVQVVFLEQTGAKEMVAVLKPLLSPGGTVSDAANNALIMVDHPENLEKLLQLIHLIDSRALGQTTIRLVKVQNTDPQEIIGELETIFTAYGTLAQKGKFGVGFIPVTRLNSVMVLSSSGSLMERAVYWIRQLDLRTDMLANVHIYHVENYKAKNLADILTQVYGGQPAPPTVKEKKPETGLITPGGAGSPLGSTGGMRPSTTGTMGGMGGMGSTTGLSPAGAEGLQPPGVPGAAGETPRAAPLKERAVPGAPGAAPGTTLKEGVRIIPDEDNNLLVVVAPPHEWNIISRILRNLDIMPRQVLNEVLIAEVRLTGELKYGLEFFLGSRPASATQQTTNPDGTTTTTPVTTSTAGLDILSGAAAALSAAGGFVFVARDTANSILAIINLLAAEGKASILASPHIMAANNQEARIQIGEEVPILTSTSTPLISQVTSFQTSTVQYRSTGIILVVKPQINASGMVTLEIAQEVSAAVPTALGGVRDTPTISIRQAKTSLITGDNQTIVLGGLIREDLSRTRTGIPGLRKVPIFGPLFGSEGTSSQRTELLVLITPHIITNLAEGAKVTRDTKDKMGLEEKTPQQSRPGAPAPEKKEAAPWY